MQLGLEFQLSSVKTLVLEETKMGATDQDALIVVAGVILIVAPLLMKIKTKRRKRLCWVKPWIGRRQKMGVHNTLLRELQAEDTDSLQNFLRLDQNSFEELLNIVSPLILRQDTCLGEDIPPSDQLKFTSMAEAIA